MRGDGDVPGCLSALGPSDRQRTDRLACVSMDTSSCSPFPLCWDRGGTHGPWSPALVCLVKNHYETSLVCQEASNGSENILPNRSLLETFSW
ncbi:hypothetical protein NHX12_023896 [Muraenolepis orangiensis]|uniref:Uncharacterized protein n=1 Tax=Muraenolepis orangiensis TaxID=630683 RepID=A0A9Q0IT80_9TELE|nr:hypothetical protein NHX12_023896 [Muraenolepis orangiensis]